MTVDHSVRNRPCPSQHPCPSHPCPPHIAHVVHPPTHTSHVPHIIHGRVVVAPMAPGSNQTACLVGSWSQGATGDSVVSWLPQVTPWLPGGPSDTIWHHTIRHHDAIWYRISSVARTVSNVWMAATKKPGTTCGWRPSTKFKNKAFARFRQKIYWGNTGGSPCTDSVPICTAIVRQARAPYRPGTPGQAGDSRGFSFSLSIPLFLSLFSSCH